MIEVLETLGIPLFLLGNILLGSSLALRDGVRVGAVVIGVTLLAFIPGVVHG